LAQIVLAPNWRVVFEGWIQVLLTHLFDPNFRSKIVILPIVERQRSFQRFNDPELIRKFPSGSVGR
jgi:hypothetical protein